MRRAQRPLVGFVGIAATVLLHSLMFAVAAWDGGQRLPHPKQPDALGSGANTGRNEGEIAEQRMIVMLSPEFSDSVPPEPPPQMPDPVIQQPSIVEIMGADTLPLPPIQIEAPGEDASDQDAELMARVKFAGIYESQIRARIERAWKFPADPAPKADFACLAQIHQERDGRVKEVDLVLSQCDGSPAWQQSLVDAIQKASPLPAPPSPSVYVDVVSLVFHSSSADKAGLTARR